MKKILGKTLLILTIVSFTLVGPAFAQGPGDPPPPPDPGSQGDVPGPGESGPVGEGLLILLALGAGYGAKKLYDNRKKKLDE